MDNLSVLMIVCLASVLSVLPMVSADIYMAYVNDTSQILQLSESPFSLEEANVLINCGVNDRGFRHNYLDANFKIKNLGNLTIETTLYLKMNGYGASTEAIEGYFKVSGEHKRDFVIKIGGRLYNAINYTFTPNEEIDLEVSYDLGLPLYYYLDGLDAYKQLKHEKILIEGYCNAKFNEHYPITLLSENNGYKKWIWEYSNVNTTDTDLKDILVVTESEYPCTPNWECGEWSNWTCDTSLPYYIHKGAKLGVETRYCYDGCGHSSEEYRECNGSEQVPAPYFECSIKGVIQSAKFKEEYSYIQPVSGKWPDRYYLKIKIEESTFEGSTGYPHYDEALPKKCQEVYPANSILSFSVYKDSLNEGDIFNVGQKIEAKVHPGNEHKPIEFVEDNVSINYIDSYTLKKQVEKPYAIQYWISGVIVLIIVIFIVLFLILRKKE